MKKTLLKGIVIRMSVMLVATLSILSSCKQQKPAEVKDLIAAEQPRWQKFIMVTEEEVPVFKEPNAESPRLLFWTENIESDMADIQYLWDDEDKPEGDYSPTQVDLGILTIWPVISEEGDFYKVNIRSPWCNVDEAYFPKACAEVIETAPITPEVLKGHSEMCFHTISEGDLKGLCLISLLGNLEQEELEVGELKGDYIVVPVGNGESHVCSYFWEEQQSVEIQTMPEETFLKYGPAEMMQGEQMIEGLTLLDPSKLSSEHVQQLYDIVTSKQPVVMEYWYYFPNYNGAGGAYRLQPFYQSVKK